MSVPLAGSPAWHGTVPPGCPHTSCSPPGWASWGAASTAREPSARACLYATVKESPHLPRTGVGAGVGLHGAVQCGWVWTRHLGSRAGNKQRHKMAGAGVVQLWMRPQTFLPANYFQDRTTCFLGGFFSSSLHYVHASKAGINFFSSLGQVGDYAPGRDGNSHLRRLKLHLPSNAVVGTAWHSTAALLC